MGCTGKVKPIMVLHSQVTSIKMTEQVIWGMKRIEMDGAFANHKEANEEVPKTCILFYGQQRPPKMVAKKLKIKLLLLKLNY